MGFIKDDMGRCAGNPTCNVIVANSEPLVVDEENLSSARKAFRETFNCRWRAETGLGFGDPGVEGRQRSHDKEPVNAPSSALGLIAGVSDGRFARAGHGKVGSVGQRQEPGEITDLERSQVTVKPAPEEQASGARLAELAWSSASQESSNFVSLGIGAVQQTLNLVVERDGAAVGDESLA